MARPEVKKRVRPQTKKRTKTTSKPRRSAAFKSMSWYESAARAIAISAAKSG